MVEANNDGEKTCTSRRENQASGVWSEKERCDDIHYAGCYSEFGQFGCKPGYKQERGSGEVCSWAYNPTGISLAGKILGQLIEDCLGQLARNETIIESLVKSNELLKEKIDSYKQTMSDLTDSKEEDSEH
jgi:hypothetical protein